MAVKLIALVIEAPLTVTVPLDGLDVYPETEPTVYEYDPLGSLNDMLPVPLCVDPPSVTDHVVPDGNPDSVKVTEYVAVVGGGLVEDVCARTKLYAFIDPQPTARLYPLFALNAPFDPLLMK